MKTEKELREEFISKFVRQGDFGDKLFQAIHPMIVFDWFLSHLKAEREELVRRVEEYVKENRDKIERLDRYVLDDILNIINNR